MGNGSGVSRGDRNRNARLARLRVLVPATNAIVGIDLADSKQMVVVTDHDSKVLARKTFRCRAWDLGAALDWAGRQASSQRASPGSRWRVSRPGHRWRVLGQLAAERGMPFVCVQPMLTSWARRSEDLTFDKTDEKDAVIIARLAAQLRCYVPEPVDETWGRLRHLGARREQLLVDDGQPGPADAGAAGVCLAGGVGDRAAAVSLLDLDRGDERRASAVTAGTWPAPAGWAWPGWSRGADGRSPAAAGKEPCLRIVRLLFAAAADPAGVTAHRPGALERVALLLADLLETHRRLGDTEARMIDHPRRAQSYRAGHLDHRPVRDRRGRDPGRDRRPDRFATARALVKHAGLAPREKLSRHLHRPHQTDRAGPARPAAGGLASRLGSPTRQPRLRRPIHPPDHPSAEQAHRRPRPRPSSPRRSCASCTRS